MPIRKPHHLASGETQDLGLITEEMMGSLFELAGAWPGSLYPVPGAASSAGAGPTSGALA